MNTRIRSIFTKRKLLFVLTILLVTGLIHSQAPNVVYAWIERDPDDRIVPINPPDFEAPPDGFTWAMEKRYGHDGNQDGMIDTFWQSVNQKYDESYIFPDHWTVNFYGCQTQGDFDSPYATPNTYTWQIVGESVPFSDGQSCVVSHDFYAQGTYSIQMTIHDSSGAIVPAGKTNPEYFQQDVTIRDILIVSLGDSYASGEGNPDIPQVYEPNPFPLPGWHLIHAAVWQDERCHRSAISGPSLAAIALEDSDPHTSVTFISFACSGATMFTENWDLGDPNKPLGSGILGPYWGAVPVGIPNTADHDTPPNYGGYIHPQMEQLEDAMVPPAGKPARQIDSLIISGGGNDMHFGDVLLSCFADDDCFASDNTIHETPFNPTDYTLQNIIQRSLGHWGAQGPVTTVPYNYALLHDRINALQPVKPAHVYLTQYPDQTRNDNGGFCDLMDDVFVPNVFDFKISRIEAQDAVEQALGPLNDHIREIAQSYVADGWQFVDGLSVYDVDPEVSNKPQPGLFVSGHDGKGHGYCASDNWIRRAEEAELIQGPLNIRLATRGQMHPNYGGHNAYKERLLRYMVPDLAIQRPQDPPAFSFSHSLDGYHDLISANTGWFLGSCDNNHNCQRKVVAQAVATSTVNLAGAQVSVNGVDGCAVEGVSCVIPTSADPKRLTFDVQITASGIYQFQFLAQDNSGQTASLEQEIRADLEGPALATPIGPFEVNEGSSVILTAAATSPGENVFDYDWDLNNDGTFETTDEQPVFSAASLDGPMDLPIQVRVTDRAGWIDTKPATIKVLNVVPTPVIDGAPATSPEGTAIQLSGSATDPGAADTISSYAWTVKKDGSDYASGTEADFSFTPSDNGSYEVALSATDDDGGVGTASQTIAVTNVAPTADFTGAPASSTEGTAISLSGSATDPGIFDTFTYAWTVKKDGSNYKTGTGASYSFTPTDNGSYEVSLKVTDKDGGTGTASQTIAVTNVAPTLSNISLTPEAVDEGGSVTLSGSITDPGSADSFTLTVDWGDGNTADTSLAAGSTSFEVSHIYADDNPTGTASDTYNLSLSLTDDDEGTGTGSTSVTVSNLAPSLTISAPLDGALYAINTSISLSGAFSDAGTDTFTCSVNWADGATTAGVITTGACTASHSYTVAGVYILQMTVADDDTGSVTEPVMVVVYDPSAGFVTGGGWINSPSGAYLADQALSGKATFGFVSKYVKGQTIPTGNTAFSFQVAGFEFASTSYEWLVVNQAGTNAQFKGSGLVNGAADPNGQAYKFMLWATDGSKAGAADTFRIRIWWEDAAGPHGVYDNGVEQAIGGGNIVVHTSK